MSSATTTINIMVDGNYLYFSARAAGLDQDFSKLETRILEHFGGAENARVGGRYFYTRPPGDTNPSAVVGWLKAHGWTVATYNFATTTQDTLYVGMIHDMWRLGTVQEKPVFVVVSGSGALAYPLATFPLPVAVSGVVSSTNRKLHDLPGIDHIPLLDLLA